MLDFRLHTYLAVCDHLSFTKAAETLHITQPAVSHHMHALQEELGKQLFTIQGRQVVLTEEGVRFRDFVRSLQLDVDRFTREFAFSAGKQTIRFGATLTIGEFTLPPILSAIMQRDVNRSLHMHVDNTEVLLTLLDTGQIDFAFIEGAFDKNRYGYRLFSHERFIAIGSHACKLRHTNAHLEDLLGERLIIRESGSGTRGVLERYLAEHGLDTASFCHVDEIGNLNVIKHLVANDLGISFLYEAAAHEALSAGRIDELEIEGWQVIREFNFVYPLNSRYEDRFLAFLDECMANTTMI